MFGRKSPLPPPPPAPLISPDALLLSVLAGALLLLVLLSPPAAVGKLSVRRVYSLSAVLLAASTLLLTAFEPGISVVDAFYLSCMTFTTIGYGDLEHPASPAGRVIVSVLALGGVAFFGITLELAGAQRQRNLLGRLISDDRLLAAGQLVLNLLLGVALCSYLTEDDNLPKGWLDSLYWSVITFTSCGFGDFHPTTSVGKCLVCAYAFATMATAANAMDVAKQQLVKLCTVQKRTASHAELIGKSD